MAFHLVLGGDVLLPPSFVVTVVVVLLEGLPGFQPVDRLFFEELLNALEFDDVVVVARPLGEGEGLVHVASGSQLRQHR